MNQTDHILLALITDEDPGLRIESFTIIKNMVYLQKNMAYLNFIKSKTYQTNVPQDIGRSQMSSDARFIQRKHTKISRFNADNLIKKNKGKSCVGCFLRSGGVDDNNSFYVSFLREGDRTTLNK